MYKTTIILALVCLLGLTSAATTSINKQNCSTTPINTQDCSTTSQCYPQYHGLYYLNIVENDSAYVLLALRPDGSFTWTSNDQTGAEQLESSEAFMQPYSTLFGQWICDMKQDGMIETKDFGFMYPTETVPDNMYTINNMMRLNMTDPKEIIGTFRFRAYDLESSYLGEAIRVQGDEYVELSLDQIGEPLTYSIKGYRLTQFC
ncbi:unnamed protein product [Adineta steineri]|uniref:Uncharacterized protein n=1 Tax=Adineta steineri TaxID=433720 RepID=A0A819JUA1_9BILA|nr:unnamed protein product [Adineta steineri]CAF3935173.1 unnamed protein product [Adineta steineri]